MSLPMKGAGERRCCLCSGCGRVNRDLGAYEINTRCPVCEGSGVVVFEEQPQFRPAGRTGQHAPSWQLAIDAAGYADYIQACHAAGLAAAHRDLYETWRARARKRGVEVRQGSGGC